MVCGAFAVVADADQLSALVVVAATVLGVTGYTWFAATRSGSEPGRPGTVHRVRQQHRLTSRSWIEVREEPGSLWIPVFFDPVLITLPTPTAATVHGVGRRRVVVWVGRRLLPSGRARRSEPAGRLIDNPSRPDPDGPLRARVAARPVRRLVLDAQFAVAAPFVGALWVYVAGGGVPAFAGATCVAAAVAVWLAAVRGSDPS
ncbi:hypothetical protein [Rhodococcus opacus]|uniref:Uncharacterized protein n=1 Tax=Rhodococcus opacus TaxID=37919 RepID=A0A2S8JDR2_RHOOP|nr:hypothetical protein [Rhodococcus opacus]PQP25198.1 hypothetical protein C5613_09800 [Rhodococcus opacus]